MCPRHQHHLLNCTCDHAVEWRSFGADREATLPSRKRANKSYPDSGVFHWVLDEGYRNIHGFLTTFEWLFDPGSWVALIFQNEATKVGVSHALVEPGTVLSCTLHGIRLLELRLPAFKPTLRGVGGGGVGGLNAHNKEPSKAYSRKYSPLPPSSLPL